MASVDLYETLTAASDAYDIEKKQENRARLIAQQDAYAIMDDAEKQLQPGIITSDVDRMYGTYYAEIIQKLQAWTVGNRRSVKIAVRYPITDETFIPASIGIYDYNVFVIRLMALLSSAADLNKFTFSLCECSDFTYEIIVKW